MKNCWLGATDEKSEGMWRWVDGQDFSSYSNWNPGEPDDAGGGQDYLLVSELVVGEEGPRVM